MRFWALTVLSLLLSLLLGVSSDTPLCGRDAGNATCPNDLCCSSAGYCGSTDAYCCAGCQSQCHNCIITESVFEEMLPDRNDSRCPGKGFYTYDAFINASKAYPEFGMTGDDDIKKRELAAFFGQTSQETSGRWIIGEETAPYTWGYCLVNETNPKSHYCDPNTNSAYPCVADKHYYGRGPIQLTWNHNYGRFGHELEKDLLYQPEKVAKDPVLSFKAALWFWMTQHPSGAPSCHEVITGQWSPSEADKEAGRKPGYGLLTNIITNGSECAKDEETRERNRIEYYLRYCDLLEVDPGDNLNCDDQKPFDDNGLLKMVAPLFTCLFADENIELSVMKGHVIYPQVIPRGKGCREVGLATEIKKYFTRRKTVNKAIRKALKVDAALLALVDQNTSRSDKIKGVQSQLENLELCIQDLDSGLKCLIRNLIKNRVSLLNILNHY
ncbi:hypothetical protein D5086_009201 [Populus alba]|uniref:Uncharacterized protein n=1 Tax=Populus alba TaxID=43335 RepID=A0ACC4CJ29_POPAL